MSAIGWQGRLNEASTREDVVMVCKDFLDACTPEEILELPQYLRPEKELAEAQDVTDYAIKLVQHWSIGDRTSAPMLDRMTAFFTKADLRLAQILSVPNAVSPAQDNSRRPRGSGPR
jgi:hypothetical protein